MFVFMIFWVESGCLGLENQECGLGGIAKTTFEEIRDLMIPGSTFYDLGWPWGEFS